MAGTMLGLIFSRDRSMQLDSMLQSFYLHMQDPDEIELYVLYTASAPELAAQYEALKADYPAVAFVRETDFRQNVLSILQESTYALFTVDDCLYVRSFSLGQARRMLDLHTDALGVSLRLGRNATFSYTGRRPMEPPPLQTIEEGLLKFDWRGGAISWGYPLEVSSSIYRTEQVLHLLRSSRFHNPNSLESVFINRARAFASTHPALLCHPASVAFCVPVNRVQTTHLGSRHGSTFSYGVSELARLFAEGYRIDVGRYAGYVPKGCHEELQLHFVKA